MVFLEYSRNLRFHRELRQRLPLRTLVFSATSGLLSNSEGHLGILLEAFQGNRDASRGEAADPGTLSNCHKDIQIPIDIQE